MMSGGGSAPLFLVLLLCTLQWSSTLGRTVKYHLEIEYGFISPDCVERQVVLVNKEFPPPTLYAREGDKVKVWVTNKLPTGEGVTIHWHGFSQIGSPWMDGVGYVSQCPIEAEETFLYEFKADKAGTYSYHGHYGLHITEGLAGAFIVHDKKHFRSPHKYDGELSLTLVDWWHKTTKEIATGVLYPPFRFPGEPESILINGRGKYNCSRIPAGGVNGTGDVVKCDATHKDCSPTILTVEEGKTYRLHISNIATMSHLNVILEGHEMTIIEADAYYTKAVPLDSLDIYPGQAVSVLFTANQKPGNYWIGVNVRSRKPVAPTGLAILRYAGATEAAPTTPAPVGPLFNDEEYSLEQVLSIKSSGIDSVPVPKKSDYQLILVQQQSTLNTVVKWSVNNVTWFEPKTPLLLGSYFGMKQPYPPPKEPPVYNYSMPPPNPNTTLGHSYYRLPYKKVIDVVLQNANMLGPNKSEIHPWHIHGHHAWIVGMGHGVFDPKASPDTYNLVDPPRRYTAAVFPYGWTTFRFETDNPGFWAFHCHIIVHQLMGMGFVFSEGVDRLPPPPNDLQFCGDFTLGYIRKHFKKIANKQ